MRGDVLEAIVPTQPATEFQPQLSRRNIEFVMHHQHLGRRDAKKTGQGADRLTGMIHIGLREQEPETGPTRLPDQTMETGLAHQFDASLGRQSFTKPKQKTV